ncbi:MAG: PepSY-like domain-containing protein [Bacteroidia bacterium]
MKTKSFIAVLLMFVAITAFTQVPQNIKDAFKSKYPSATVKSFKYLHNNYVATFVYEGEKCKATFDGNANWIQTISHKEWKEMPEAVRIALHRSRYSNWQVYECNKVETPDGIFYSFQVDNEYTLSGDEQPAFSEDCFVYFTPSGNIVKEAEQ